MSLYTIVRIHPADSTLQPSEEFIKELLEFFGVSKIEFATGNADSHPDDDEEDEDLFFLEGVTLEESFRAMRNSNAAVMHLGLPFEGFLRAFAHSISESIPPEIAGDFVPWVTGITLGNWYSRDYNTDEVLAHGNFCIKKSGNGCPPNMAVYLNRFNTNPELQKIITFLELQTGYKWETSIQLT